VSDRNLDAVRQHRNQNLNGVDEVMYMTCTDLITDRTSSNQLSANSSTDQLCPIFDSNTDGYTVPTTDIFSTTIVTDRQQLNILRVLDPDLSPNLQQQKETAAAAGRRKASKPLKGSESTAYQRQLREQRESRQDNTDFEVLSRTCRLVTFIFDTGASTTIVDVDLNKYLSNVSRSNVSISGFHGSTSVDGDKYEATEMQSATGKCKARQQDLRNY
jgi:hypothetical protein